MYEQHEGFCVPLVESMLFDVPIIAFESSAISDTLKDSGIIFLKGLCPSWSAFRYYYESDGY